jgi:hypothetical protein
MELTTLADVRILVEKHLPADTVRSSAGYPAGPLRRVAQGEQDIGNGRRYGAMEGALREPGSVAEIVDNTRRNAKTSSNRSVPFDRRGTLGRIRSHTFLSFLFKAPATIKGRLAAPLKGPPFST